MSPRNDERRPARGGVSVEATACGSNQRRVRREPPVLVCVGTGESARAGSFDLAAVADLDGRGRHLLRRLLNRGSGRPLVDRSEVITADELTLIAGAYRWLHNGPNRFGLLRATLSAPASRTAGGDA